MAANRAAVWCEYSPQSFLQIKPGSLSLYFFLANPRALIMIASQICWYKVGKKYKVSAKVKKFNSRKYLLDWAKLLIVTPLPKQDPSKWSVGLLSYELFIFRGKGELEDRGGPGIIFSSRPEYSFFSSSFFSGELFSLDASTVFHFSCPYPVLIYAEYTSAVCVYVWEIFVWNLTQ